MIFLSFETISAAAAASASETTTETKRRHVRDGMCRTIGHGHVTDTLSRACSDSYLECHIKGGESDIAIAGHGTIMIIITITIIIVILYY